MMLHSDPALVVVLTYRVLSRAEPLELRNIALRQASWYTIFVADHA